MNFDHIVSDGTGLIHLISSTMALLAGTVVLIKPKGTKYHKKLGYVYTIFMTIVLVTSFLMYNLYGRFGIFHFLATVSTITLLGGIVPMYLKRPSSYITMHFSFMYWSVLGLYGAFIAEILVRIPQAIVQEGAIDPMFYNLIGLAVFIIMGVGYFFFGKKKKAWAKLDKS